MSGKKNSSYEAKAEAAIDRALEHRDDSFRAKVLDLTLKNQWDVDDPAFLILLSTGEMRVLMEQFPAMFEAVMNEVFKQGEARWQAMNARLLTAVEKQEQAAERVRKAINQVQQKLSLERMQVSVELDKLKAELAEERKQTSLAWQQAAKEQSKVLEAESRMMLANLGQQARDEGKKQFQVLNRQLRRAHFWELFIYAGLMAIALWFIGWLGGWTARAHTQQTDIWSDIKRWNKPELKACLKAKVTTCNFHIQVPE